MNVDRNITAPIGVRYVDHWLHTRDGRTASAREESPVLVLIYRRAPLSHHALAIQEMLRRVAQLGKK